MPRTPPLATSDPDPDPDPEWLNTDGAARRLGLNSRTVYRLVNQGELAAYRFGRVIRIRVQDVDAYIAASRIEPGTLDHLDPNTSKLSVAAARSS